jgi:RNA polymerase sigma factor (sigma-70 family)
LARCDQVLVDVDDGGLVVRLSAAAERAGVSRIGCDPDAFEAFYREHVESVQRFVSRRVSDRELAAELTSDIFVAAIESAGSYRRSRGTPVAWLFGVARVVVSSELRRQGRERRATSRLLGRRLLDEDAAARIDERLDAEAQRRRLYEAMACLPDGQRAVLELVAVDGLTLTEAAGALGINPLAARVRLHRARARMTDLIDPATQDPGPSPRAQEAAQ